MISNHSRLRDRTPFFSFVVFTFAGIAIGYKFGNIVAGTLVGLGAGLILMVVLRFILYRKKTVAEDPESAASEN
jgi:hypothetical protein